ncbi:MAG: hemerythrin domain-containing protein [Devosia sp.]
MTLPNRPIEALEQSYAELLALCDGLEEVADTLPHDVSPRICLTLAAGLEPLIAQMHGLEEEALFPLLEASQSPQLSQTLARLRHENLADQSTAAEVSEALHDLGTGRSALSPDAMGYLLRSFFESMRRHVQSERELIAMVPPTASDGGR